MRTETLRNGKTIYMGFENFAEADYFAKHNNGKVYSFKKRDGQDWVDLGIAYEPYDIKSFLYEDNLCVRMHHQDDYRDENAFYEEWVSEFIGDMCETFDEAYAFLARYNKLWEMYLTLGEDEILVEDINSCNDRIVPKFSMTYSYDVYSYEIGVIIEEQFK